MIRSARRPGAVLAAAAAAFLLLPAGTALADTSTATANAAWVTVAGTTATTGDQRAANDGDQGTVTSTSTPVLAAGSQPLITVGRYVQTAVAYADGRSAACAGLVGAGGSITINSAGTCVVTAGSGGVSLKLTSLATITADAITASCTAASDGTVTGAASLAGAKVNVAGVLPLALAATPAPDTGVTVKALGATIARLNLNEQNVDGGKITVGALWTAVLSPAVSSMIGTVTCGANVRVLPTPALPVHAASLGGAAAVIGVWAVLAHRTVRRRLARS